MLFRLPTSGGIENVMKAEYEALAGVANCQDIRLINLTPRRA